MLVKTLKPKNMKKLLVSLSFALLMGGEYSLASEIVVSPSCQFATLVLTEVEYAQWDDSLFEKYTKQIYEKFNDDFDFIVYVLNEEVRPQKFSYAGVNYVVSADESGIGFDPYNDCSSYGSAGRLQSVIHLPFSIGISYGPFLHEITHRWANFGIPTIDFDNYELPSHWGITGGSTPGQLGGFQESLLQSNVDGDPTKYRVPSFGEFANRGNSVPYNDMELYLMGMIPLSDVQPFTVFNSIDSYTYTRNETYDGSYFTFSSQQKTTYNPTNIEALLGQRVPNSTASQKNFNVLFVVVSDSALTTEECTHYDTEIASFCSPASDESSYTYNFWEATRGLGSLTAEHIDLSLKQQTAVETVTSVNKLSLSPSVVGNDGFYIKNVLEQASYNVYDITGMKVVGGTVSADDLIPSASLTSGIYMVSVRQGDKVQVLKLIKE